MIRFNSNKWLSIVTVLLLLANIATLTVLWMGKKMPNPGSDSPGRDEPVFQYVINSLGLDSIQIIRYDSMRKEHHRQQLPLQDSLAFARKNCFASMEDPTVTDSMVRELIAQTAVWQQQLELLNYNHFRELRSICDAKQQSILDQILETVLKRLARPPGRPGRREHAPPHERPGPEDREGRPHRPPPGEEQP